MHVPVAALTDFNHHQGRICKHVRHLKQKSGFYKILTLHLCPQFMHVVTKIQACGTFALTVSRLVLLSTKYFII